MRAKSASTTEVLSPPTKNLHPVLIRNFQNLVRLKPKNVFVTCVDCVKCERTEHNVLTAVHQYICAAHFVMFCFRYVRTTRAESLDLKLVFATQ